MPTTELEESSPPVTLPTPTPFDSPDLTQTVAPTAQTVESNSTVKGQMEGLLAEGSDYTRLAEQKATETANSRGLLNSSMAAGAGTRAAIESALPIAQQDAQQYHQQALANQQYENQFGTEENKANYASQMADQDVGRQEQLANTKTQLDLLKQNDAQAYQTFLANLNTDNQQQLMAAEAHIKSELAAIQQDYAVQLETIKSQLAIQGNLDSQLGVLYADNIKSIGTILASPDIPSAEKNTLVATMMSNMNTMSSYINAIKAVSKTEQVAAESQVIDPTLDLYQPGYGA